MRIAREAMRAKEVFILCRTWVVVSSIYRVRNLCARSDGAHQRGLIRRCWGVFEREKHHKIVTAVCNTIVRSKLCTR